ncbi:putative uncharacterized protein [Pseudarthrobacter siccitolerans]|uniref:Uncharacterized protein n=1 Tax=Pseudarthrobacter siccitolerans TaxID=861266 RepID=A0A024H3A9_9MICC|nr:hypothetical protein [Pseudarthrobacter siccitolerans]CCQ46367.1 putative uncharacterized protein [Pseudarthrobacter siccitolerans]
MTIDVLLNGTRTPIDEEVFTALLDNSVASTYAAYGKAIASSSIDFTDLVFLARKGEIPYVLFFAPLPVVEAQIKAKSEKLLSGLTKETFSVNSRDRVNLRDVELIVKDLLRKQELLKKNDKTLTPNRIVGLLGKPGRSVEEDAGKLMDALGLSHDSIRSVRKKEDALELLIARLETNQVLVSRSVNNFMPQRITGVKFSGMTVKDAKVPYIFLSGGDHGDYQEPAGRMVFTLALMSVLVARRIFAPVTYDGSSTGSDVGREYDIVGAMLMPKQEFRGASFGSLDDVKAGADVFKVTPSAMAVRAMRLGMITPEVAASHLQELRREYAQRAKTQARQPKAVNAVRKYNGRELSRRMLDVLDAGQISKREFCRVVCLRHIKPHQINDFREALR